MNKRKNILLLFPDQHRGDWLPFEPENYKQMGIESLPVKMDNLKKIMKSGTTFTRAASNSPLCSPARACLASGKHYNHIDAYNNRFCYPLNQKTFYSVLNDGGYNVFGVGKFDLHKPILYWEKSGWIKQLKTLGFTDAVDSEGKYDAIWSSLEEPKGPYSNFLHSNGFFETHTRDYINRYYNVFETSPTPLPDSAYADNWVTDNALRLLEKYQSEEDPWFMMVNFSGPHDPWDVTIEMKERWKNVDFPLPVNFSGDKEKINGVRQNYAAMLENIDLNIGRIVKHLEESGELDDTLIIYASDHGEMLGDHSRFFKCVPNRGSVLIPLVINGPGVRKGVVCDELVQLHDLFATIIDFAELPLPEGTDSLSLKRLATENNAPAIRDFQAVMLCNSFMNPGNHEGYEEYSQYKKQKLDSEYIKEYTREHGLPVMDAPVEKKQYYKNWWSTITRDYKLSRSDSGEYELYDLKNDLFEENDISKESPEIVEQLKSLYDFSIPEYGIHDEKLQ